MTTMRIAGLTVLACLLGGGTPASAGDERGADLRVVQVSRSVLRAAPEPLSDSLVVVPLGTRLFVVGERMNDYDPVDAARLHSDNPGLEIQVRAGVDLGRSRAVWVGVSDVSLGALELGVTGASSRGVAGGHVAAFRGNAPGALLPLSSRAGRITDVAAHGYDPDLERLYAKANDLVEEFATLTRLQKAPEFKSDPFALADALVRFGGEGNLTGS